MRSARIVPNEPRTFENSWLAGGTLCPSKKRRFIDWKVLSSNDQKPPSAALIHADTVNGSQILHHLECKDLLNNMGYSLPPTSTGYIAGFLNHQQICTHTQMECDRLFGLDLAPHFAEASGFNRISLESKPHGEKKKQPTGSFVVAYALLLHMNVQDKFELYGYVVIPCYHITHMSHLGLYFFMGYLNLKMLLHSHFCFKVTEK